MKKVLIAFLCVLTCALALSVGISAISKNTVEDVLIEGVTGESIESVDIDIYLEDDEFSKSFAKGEKVDWITNLPEKLEARVKTAVKKGDYEVTLTISGTPEKAIFEEMIIIIPSNILYDDLDIVIKNPDAVFEIRPAAPKLSKVKLNEIYVVALEGQVYAIKEDGEKYFGNFQQSGIFKNLEKDTDYVIVTCRTQDTYAKERYSDYLYVSTDKSWLGAPEGLTAKTVSSTEIALAWFEVKDAAGYKIAYREAVEEGKENKAGWTEKLVSGAEEYNVTGLSPDTSYEFKILSVASSSSDFRNSDYSDIVIAKTLGVITDVKAVGYNGVYDGKAYGITLSGKKEADTVTYTYNGKTYDKSPEFTDAGEYIVSVAVSRVGFEDLITTATVRIDPKQLSRKSSVDIGKVYDGTTVAEIAIDAPIGVIGDDSVALVVTGTFPKADAGKYFIPVVYKLTGEDKDNYIAPKSESMILYITPATIDKFNLTRYIDAPAAGSSPVKSFSTEQYTATVEWTPGIPTGGKFVSGTAYTAKVTLTATNNYQFVDVTANLFTHKYASTITNVKGSTIVYIVFDKTAAWENPYIDVKESEWSYQYIRFVTENDFMSGISEYQFAPDSVTTRAMLVEIFWHIEGEPLSDYTIYYEDVSATSPYYKAIRWATETGIIKGYTSLEFGMYDKVTREQLSAIFRRYAAYKGYDVSATADLSAFKDAPSEWAVDDVKWAISVGLIEGKGSGILDPEGDALRSECAAILTRFIKNILN